MLLPKDTNPKNTVYYNGALTLNVIKESDKKTFDSFDLYEKLKQYYNLSFQSYLFALDWLFLIGAIKLAKNGKMEKCF
jgi:hypothetical protein